MDSVIHNVDHEVLQSWGRFGCLARTYAGIALSSLDEFFIEKENPVVEPTQDEDRSEYFAHEDRILKASIKTIVFSAMACEAAIYDLAAIQLTDQYATSIIDKLDLVGKWLVVPRLICGKELNAKGPAINCLRTLTKARNSLVHFKSMPAPFEVTEFKAQIDKANKQHNQIIQNCPTSYQTVILLSLELNRLLKAYAGVLPFFEIDILGRPDCESSKPVLSLIKRSREIDLNAMTLTQCEPQT